MIYPNGGTTPTTVHTLGNAIHRATTPLAHTGIPYLPLVVAGLLALAAGLTLTVWATLCKPITFPWE